MAGWAAPVVREIRARAGGKKLRIALVVPPCQYASGHELHYGNNIDGVDRTLRFMQLFVSPSNCGDGRSLVLHLGGDFLYSTLLSRWLKAPLFAYAARPRWKHFVDHFFIPDAAAERLFSAHGLAANSYSRVGHLALDSVVLAENEQETRLRLGIDPSTPMLAFLTGSRPLEYREGIPFFSKVATEILKVYPEYEPIFPMAPTVDQQLFARYLDSNKILWRGKSRVREVHLGDDRWARVLWDYPLEAINCCSLAVTVPGTNNLQLAALYIPFVMALPLQKAEEFPLDGIGGCLPLFIPGVKGLKRRIIFKMNERIPFVSLPNRLAGRMIAPEIRGLIGPRHVAQAALELLDSKEKREGIARAFWDLTHERGAATRIARSVMERLS